MDRIDNAAVSPKPGIGDQLRELSDCITGVAKAVEGLAAKLAPILTPGPELTLPAEPKGPTGPTNSPVADTLASMHRRLTEVEGALLTTTSRVEL